MAQIALKKPSGGELIITPEDGTSTETVTIPSVGVGKVLQVASNNFSSGTHYTTTSSTYVSAGSIFSLGITPVSTNSKLIVHINIGMAYTPAGNDLRYRVDVNGSVLDSSTYDNYIFAASTSKYDPVSFQYIYNNTDTSSKTFNLQVMSGNSAQAYYFHGGTRYSITITEVAV